MIIISYGITKTGSTLAFETLKGCLAGAGFAQRKLPAPPIDDAPRENYSSFCDLSERTLDMLLEEVGDDERIVIKTHGFLPENQQSRVRKLIEDGEVLVQVSHRDPRDTCLSMLDAGTQAREKGRIAFSNFVALDDTIQALTNGLREMQTWEKLPDVLHVEYDRLAFSPYSEIPKISDRLGLSANTEDVLSYTNSAFTQKNKAERNRYMREMTRADQERVIKAAGPYMREHGYPVSQMSVLWKGLFA